MHQQATFDDFVSALVKPGADILASLSPVDCHLLHMGVGVAGEAGELIDALKRSIIYNNPLDRENIIEELGDIEFYVSSIRRTLGISRDEVLAACVGKLRKRFPNAVYSDNDATSRKDKTSG